MKPSILFIMHMPPPIHGAAMVGQYIYDSKLINDSFDCHYINLTTAGSLTDIGRVSFNKVKKFLGLLKKIRSSVNLYKPKLVYVTPNACGRAFYKDFIVVQMLKGMGCKLVVHYHNKGVSTRQDRWLDNLLYRRFFRGLKVILLAEALYNDVSKYVKREDVFICPNGIPKTQKEEPSVHRNNPVPRLLFLSNLLISKGVLVLLDACKILKDKGYSFICDFVGGETTEIDAMRFEREVAERGLNRIAIFNGRSYGEEKDNFFEDADVFVFPTFYKNETFGLVNLEAMEHKLPIVATNEGGIADVVKDGENGLICERQNAKLLATCLEKLLGDVTLREKMGEDGYKKFVEHFTIQAFEKNFTGCIRKAMRGGVSVNLVLYHGKKYGDEKNWFLRNADIFVLPTFYHNECFPLVLLEAMQSRLPCLFTDEGGISDIIDDGITGFIIRKNSAEALAEKMEFLFLHPDIIFQMGKEGYEKFLLKYTIEKFEYRIINILSFLIGYS